MPLAVKEMLDCWHTCNEESLLRQRLGEEACMRAREEFMHAKGEGKDKGKAEYYANYAGGKGQSRQTILAEVNAYLRQARTSEGKGQGKT